MSGLILANIGKSIADAGATIGNMMYKDIADRNAEERALRRQEELIRLREESDERRKETLQQKIASQAVEVTQKAEARGINRDAEAVGRVGALVGGTSPVMSQEEIAALIKENPQYREIYRKSGIIQDKIDPRLQRATDEEAIAREVGAHSSLIESYSKSKDAVLKQIAEERKERVDRTREEQTNRRLDLMERNIEGSLKIRERNADTAAERAAKSGNKPDASGKPPTGIDLERAAKAAEKALALELGVPVKDVPEKIASLRKQNRITPDVQGKIDEYTSALTTWKNYKRTTPTSPSESSGDNPQRPPLSQFKR